jgi:hypothetical protein
LINNLFDQSQAASNILKVFACLDIKHPIVAWGAYRGVLVSALADFSQEGCPVSMMLAEMLRTENGSRLKNELEIERIRQMSFPSLPSRLTAMYFFESSTDIERISNWGPHFRREYCAELNLYPTDSVSRHDSNWITNAKLDSSGHIVDTDWIPAYWKGEPFQGDEPIWELLAHGRAVILSTKLRQRAYETIKRDSPLAVSILEVSRIAALLESDLGQAKAFLIDNANGTASINFYLDMRDAENSNFLARVRDYEGPKNYEDLAVGGNVFYLPDSRWCSSTFRIDEPLVKTFLNGIHRKT